MTWPGLWPGVKIDVELEPGELQRLAAGDGLVGVVALERAEARPGDEGVDVGEHRHLDLGAVDRRPGRPRQRGDGADVVEVGVGEEDRLDLAPIPPAAARIRSASSPGSTTRSFSDPSARTRKQFSAIGPTVSISTSSATTRSVARIRWRSRLRHIARSM